MLANILKKTEELFSKTPTYEDLLNKDNKIWKTQGDFYFINRIDKRNKADGIDGDKTNLLKLLQKAAFYEKTVLIDHIFNKYGSELAFYQTPLNKELNKNISMLDNIKDLNYLTLSIVEMKFNVTNTILDVVKSNKKNENVSLAGSNIDLLVMAHNQNNNNIKNISQVNDEINGLIFKLTKLDSKILSKVPQINIEYLFTNKLGDINEVRKALLNSINMADGPESTITQSKVLKLHELLIKNPNDNKLKTDIMYELNKIHTDWMNQELIDKLDEFNKELLGNKYELQKELYKNGDILGFDNQELEDNNDKKEYRKLYNLMIGKNVEIIDKINSNKLTIKDILKLDSNSRLVNDGTIYDSNGPEENVLFSSLIKDGRLRAECGYELGEANSISNINKIIKLDDLDIENFEKIIPELTEVINIKLDSNSKIELNQDFNELSN